jgi:1-acyl-sn-glycerol-3-phosphate acyltransferase
VTFYRFVFLVSKQIFKICTRKTPLLAHGQENIPQGPVVICANHAHNSDPFYVVYSFPGKDKIWIMCKEEIRHIPVAGWFLNSLGFAIWVKRGKADISAVKNALKALKGGEKLLIFPEGTRHEEMGEGKTGAAMLAIRTGVPVLPIYVSTTRVKGQHTEVFIGKPFHPFTEDRRANAADYEAATVRIMDAIRALKPGDPTAPAETAAQEEA